MRSQPPVDLNFPGINRKLLHLLHYYTPQNAICQGLSNNFCIIIFDFFHFTKNPVTKRPRFAKKTVFESYYANFFSDGYSYKKTFRRAAQSINRRWIFLGQKKLTNKVLDKSTI